MVVFPNAKINIGLSITEKRADGFHNLASCFYPIGWKDILEIIPSKTTTQFSSSGIDIPGDPSNNLCLQAYELLKQDYNLPPVLIHLHKIIPIGAGLGGGSADAAFTIINLNKQFSLELTTAQMIAYARQLGSDCAFFIENKPTFATEKGDIFQEINLNLSENYILLVNPAIHISTKEAYAGITPQVPSHDLKKTLETSLPLSWNGIVLNDFENHLFKSYPLLKDIKQQLYDAGASYASMTGSGATVYGIFDKKPPQITFDKKYTVKSLKLDDF